MSSDKLNRLQPVSYRIVLLYFPLKSSVLPLVNRQSEMVPLIKSARAISSGYAGCIYLYQSRMHDARLRFVGMTQYRGSIALFCPARLDFSSHSRSSRSSDFKILRPACNPALIKIPQSIVTYHGQCDDAYCTS